MSIDNRIVNMKLENTQFTSAANATMNTLKKLGDTLKLSEGARGLENIAGKVKSVDLSPISKGIDAVKNNFSLLDVVGVTALANIANSAVNSGKKMLSALTIDPIMSGFNEYETKMGSITTIMTNTAHAGTTMEDVTKTLDELNTYADQTIYNFAEMTRNIGTFTAAGVSLDDSAVAIKGIANLAAGSGSTSAQASTAMYQLSQALASGTVNLQDWNSVVNAGMGGQLFQNALKETGKAMGAVIDDSQTFRESISAKDGTGWLTSDILLTTLKKFASDPALLEAATQVKTFTQLVDTMKESVQSGWSQSWENIIGNKDEAALFFTAVSDGFNNIMGPMADYRNEGLKFWKENDGREAVIAGLANIMKTIGRLLGPIYEAYKKIIDPWNGERLVDISKGFQNLTSKLVPTEKTMEYIGKTFEGLFSIIKIGGLLLKPFISLFTGLAGTGTPVIELFFRLTSIMTGWITTVANFIENSKLMEFAMNGMADVGEFMADIIGKAFSKSTEWVTYAYTHTKEFTDKLIEVMTVYAEQGRILVEKAAVFIKAFNEEHKPLENTGEFIAKAFSNMKEAISDFVSFVKTAGKVISDFFESIVKRVQDSNIQAIDLVNVGLFASILMIGKKIIPFIKNMFGAVGEFKDSAIAILEQMQGVLESYQKNIKADTIMKIATALVLLAGAVWILSTIEVEKLVPAVAALGVLMGGLTLVLKQFDKIDPSGVFKSAGAAIALVGFATAVTILASAMVKLAELNWNQIIKATTALAIVAIGLVKVAKSLDGVDIGAKQGVALMLMAGTMYVLAGAMAIIGSMDVPAILKSLGAMGAVLTGLSIFFKSTKGIDNINKVALSLLPLSASMLIFAGALLAFGNMSPGTLMQGFTVLAITLTQLALFAKSFKSFKGDMLNVGAGILLISGAMVIFAGALFLLGNLNIGTTIQGLITMAAVLTIFAGVMKLMPEGQLIKAGVAIAILSASLIGLAVGLAMMGKLNAKTVGGALLAIAASLAVLAGVSYLIAAAATPMLVMAGVVAVLGLAAAVAGGGLLVLSAGMVGFAGAIMSAGVGVTGALTALAASIPILMAALALGLVSFITIIGSNSVALQMAFTKLLQALIAVIINNIPGMLAAITLFVSEMLTMIVTLTPQIVDAVITVLLSVLGALAEHTPAIVTFVIEFLDGLIVSVLDGLANSIPKIVNSIVNVITSILNAIGEGIPKIVDAMFDLVIKVVNGFTKAIETRMPEVRKAVKNLLTAIKNEFFNAIGDFNDIGSSIMEGIKDGIWNGVISVKNAIVGVAENAVGWAKDVLGINSPSKVFAEIGKWTDEGLAQGLVNNAGVVKDGAEGLANTTIDSMRNAMQGVSDLIDTDMNQPTIRPVLDLSEIQNGAGQIGSMVDGNYAIRASANGAMQTSSNMLNRAASQLGAIGGSTTNDNRNTSVTNNFNITGSNPEEIANEVSRIIQSQVERRDSVWA